MKAAKEKCGESGADMGTVYQSFASELGMWNDLLARLEGDGLGGLIPGPNLVRREA